MKLYDIRASEFLDTTLLSYVDDGTIITQSRHLGINMTVLKSAYGVIFDFFTRAGLTLEHSKTELFHFSRARNETLPSVDLGYAPFTGTTPLTPKLYWRYLGFYFDRQLKFHEHVRYYSTKALTSVMAMGMLGNSARGLQAKERRTLYRSCVLPIATYGHHLWYYNGAPCKGVMKILGQMQRKGGGVAKWKCQPCHALKIALPAVERCWVQFPVIAGTISL